MKCICCHCGNEHEIEDELFDLDEEALVPATAISG
jgi:hypothetical protein